MATCHNGFTRNFPSVDHVLPHVSLSREGHPLITDKRNQNIKFHFPTAAIEHQGCEEFLNYYVNGLEMKCMVTAFIPSLPRIDLIITSLVTAFRHSPPSMIYTFQNSFNFLLSLNDHSSTYESSGVCAFL